MGFEIATINGWSFYHVPEITEAGIVHGFMTASSDAIIRDENERMRFVAALGASDMVILKQEHSNVVHVIDGGARPQAGDGLIMKEKGVIGVIKTADCLPVILYDRSRPLAAIVHAGWRGSAARITEKALQAMIDLGAQPGSMGALIGPGIGPCCYEVGEEVRQAFLKNRFPSSIFVEKGASLYQQGARACPPQGGSPPPPANLDPLRGCPASPSMLAPLARRFPQQRAPVGIYLDLKKANRSILESNDVQEIYDADLCTMCKGDLFHSFRRDKGIGRQVNFVLISH